MLKKLWAFAIVALITIAANPLVAQVRTADQLASLIVNEFRNASAGDRQVVVRDFRTPGSVNLGLTELVKSKLEEQGYQVGLVADYEIEGRVKKLTDYRGFQRYVFKLTVVSPHGFDRTQQFSIAPALANMSGGGTNNRKRPAVPDNSGGINVPDAKPSPGRHQIYPDEEWKVYEVSPKVVRHMQNGFITNRGDWRTFWAMCKTELDLPQVDFEKQIVRVEMVSYPRTINAEIFSAGDGNIDVTKDISDEAPAGNGLLNGHILIINKSDIQQKRKIRLGVTVDATIDNRGVIITSVVDGAPITRGKLDDGRTVALEPGDVILSLDGISTNSVGGFAKLIKSSRGLLRAEVRNVQNGEVIYVTFELN